MLKENFILYHKYEYDKIRNTAKIFEWVFVRRKRDSHCVKLSLNQNCIEDTYLSTYLFLPTIKSCAASHNSLLISPVLNQYKFKIQVNFRGRKLIFKKISLDILYSAGMLNAAFSSFLFEFYDRKWIWTKSL